MMKRLFIFLIFPLSLPAQDTVPQRRLDSDKTGLRSWQGQPFNGCAIVYSYSFKEGKRDSMPATLVSYKEGRVEGPYKIYRKGVAFTCGNYHDQKKEGEWKSYDEWGRVAEVTPYVNGKVNGEFKRYQYKGDSVNAPARLQNRVMYNNDTMTSALESYESDGSLYNRTWFSKHKKHGPEIYYYNDGKKRSELNNYFDQPEGTSREWYPRGQLKVIGEYVKGKRTGSWFYYYPDGSLKIEEQYPFGSSLSQTKNINYLSLKQEGDAAVLQLPQVKIRIKDAELYFKDEEQLSSDTLFLHLQVGSQLDQKKTSVTEGKGRLSWSSDKEAEYLTVKARKGFRRYNKVLRISVPKGC